MAFAHGVVASLSLMAGVDASSRHYGAPFNVACLATEKLCA